jgi:hypothetical protein
MGAGPWRPGGLLGSPFNVKWRFSAPAGDVEGSKLCLFSVIMPAKCVSSVSPRFHYRRLAFCFLPLAAILEFFSHAAFKPQSKSLLCLSPEFCLKRGNLSVKFMGVYHTGLITFSSQRLKKLKTVMKFFLNWIIKLPGFLSRLSFLGVQL